MGNTIVGGGVVDDLPVPVPVPLLPEEVLIEILLWLPVISLLRFKSVSKSWRDLIQTSFFIHLHATFFNSSSSKQLGGGSTYILQMSPFILGAGGWARERKMFMLSFGSGGSIDDDDEVVFKMDDLDFPPYYKLFPWENRILMVGSCNGLICLHDSELREISLWNPATRQFRILPKSITIQEEGIGKFIHDFAVFGFDVKTKDYKVVQISCFRPTCIEQWRPECICRVQVYSLSTDSWRFLEGINYLPAKPIHVLIWNQLGLYLNGSYFFLGTKCPPSIEEELHEQREVPNERLMFSFDFTKEIFSTMQLPDHDRRYDFVLTRLGDKIALFTTRIKPPFGGGGGGDDDQSQSQSQSRCDCDDDYENYDIWVLNEQGGDDDVNKESWAKLHSFRIKSRVARDWVRPRGILNNGEFALIEAKTEYYDDVTYHVDVFNELQLLNLVTKVPTKSFPISERVLESNIYKQSLVSVIGGNGTTTANRVVGVKCSPL